MQETLTIGIDVAKAELVIGVVDHPELNRAIANTVVPIKRWLKTVPQGSRIAVESTGGYHSLVVQLAQEQALATYVLNAKDVYFYAKALGQRGKTDRTDAQVISRYLKEHHEHLRTFCPGSQAEQRISQLLRRRAQLVDQREAVRLSLGGVAELHQQTNALITQFDRVTEAIDQQIAQQISSQQALAADTQRLTSIPGVGIQGAVMLACLFRRIGFKTMDAVVAFSGLDPRPMDSGQKRGRRRLSKRGPPLLRRQLFMMGFSASRSKLFQPFYQSLRTRGFSATAAFIILARKLLRIAFAVWRSQTPFDATYVSLKTT